MVKKILYGCIAALAVVPLVTSAQSFDIQAEIAALLQQVQALQGELQSAIAPPQTTAPSPAPSPAVTAAQAGCVSLSRTLSLGASGKDVLSLQRYLSSDASIYPEGTASGYFGALTERAVKRFQVKYGVVSSGSPSTTGYGAVGPRTRALLLEKSCGISIPDVDGEGGVARCAISSDKSAVLANQPVTVSWNSANAAYAIDNTSGERVELRGSKVFYPAVASTYTYSFFGGTVSLPAVCSVRVTIATTDSVPGSTPSTSRGQVAPTPATPLSGDTLVATPATGNAPLYVQFVFKARAGIFCGARQLSIEYGDGENSMLETNLCVSANMRSVYHLYKKTGAFTARVYDNSYCAGNAKCSASVEVGKALVAVSGLSACSQGGVTVPHGSSRDFYSAPSAFIDETCASRRLSRLCMDGVLSGAANYSYANCSEATAASCSLDGATVANGASRTFYSQASVTSGTCAAVSQSRVCSNGTLSGSATYNKANCSIAAPTCTLDGLTLQSGSSTTFYFAQNIPYGELCTSYGQARTCTNSTLSGSSSYKYASCTPVSSNSCALDNVVITNGSSATFYDARTAPAGELCSAHVQSRTCTNGTLSGSAAYIYTSCVNQTTCTLDGKTLGHSSSTVFYKERTVAFGSTCSGISLTRTCTNGKLSGGDEYKYVACSVMAP